MNKANFAGLITAASPTARLDLRVERTVAPTRDSRADLLEMVERHAVSRHVRRAGGVPNE